MCPQAFVFLLHKPVTEQEQSQMDRLERKVDGLAVAVELIAGRMALVLKAIADREVQQTVRYSNPAA